MKLTKLSDIFDVKHGVSLEYNAMTPDVNGVPFVSRQSKNNGVVGRVALIETVKPNPANTISVAGGGSVMESFLHKEPYYSGRDLYYLNPKISLSDSQLLYYCTCLRANKYKYSYGRQANRTLKDLLIPPIDSIPPWVESIKTPTTPSVQSASSKQIALNTDAWKEFLISDVFSMLRGKRLKSQDRIKGSVLYCSASKDNTGFTEYIENPLFIESNALLYSTFGDANYIASRFTASDEITILKNNKLNVFTGLFISTVLNKGKYKYAFGRKAFHSRLCNDTLKLPTTKEGIPDWQFMEDYIKSLPYSQNLAD